MGSRVNQKVPFPFIHHHLPNVRKGAYESCRFQELPGCVGFLSLEYFPLFSRMECFSSDEITRQYFIPIFWFVLVNKDLQHNLGSLVSIYCFASTTTSEIPSGKVFPGVLRISLERKWFLLADTFIFSFPNMFCLENSPEYPKNMFLNTFYYTVLKW